MSADIVKSWDREMTMPEFRRLSPGDKHERTITSFKRKIAFLKRAVDEPLLLMTLDQTEFKSRAALRRWEKPEHGFWEWGDPEVDRDDGVNQDLFEEWQTQVKAIDILKKGKNYDLKKELEAQKLINENLEAQVVALTDQIGMLHRKLQEKREARV